MAKACHERAILINKYKPHSAEQAVIGVSFMLNSIIILPLIFLMVALTELSSLSPALPFRPDHAVEQGPVPRTVADLDHLSCWTWNLSRLLKKNPQRKNSKV